MDKDDAGRWTPWRVVAYDDPSDPVEHATSVHLKGTREAVSESVDFDLWYDFKGNEIDVWYRCDVPPELDDKPVGQVRCQIGKITNVIAMATVEETNPGVAQDQGVECPSSYSVDLSPLWCLSLPIQTYVSSRA